MKTSIASCIRTYTAIFLNLCLSAFGCFVLMRCFRLVAEGIYGHETVKTVVATGQARDPIAYVGAALILMALAASDQLGMMHATPETHF